MNYKIVDLLLKYVCLRRKKKQNPLLLRTSTHRLINMCHNYFLNLLKGGAYFCYCAYVLRILRYSDFLWVVPTNTGVFLRGLKLCGESRTFFLASALGIQKENIWG